jgi:hypothetical protein
MTSLFLAWQAPADCAMSRAWFPVGLLDAGLDHSPRYRFRYTQGARNAQEAVGFQPLPAFPEFERAYESDELFPLFRNRVLSSKRRDFEDYVHWLSLDPEKAAKDPIMILAASGGARATDNLEVFPKVRVDGEGHFRIRFFLHGLRHLPTDSVARASELRADEALRVSVELNNPATRIAVTLHTEDYRMVGWAPRYLVDDLVRCVPHAPEIAAHVVQVNPPPAPVNQRVLVEYRGRTPGEAEPMSTPDFLPLVS